MFIPPNCYVTSQGGENISPEKEEVYEKAIEADTAAEIEAGATEDEAEDVETKELLRNGEAEAPNRTSCLRLRRRRPPPMLADGEGRIAGREARRESMRQVDAEIAGEGEVEAKAAMEKE